MSSPANNTTARRPDFLGIGAQRGATTWLFECLQAHPEIFVPAKKEVHFFDENYESGWNWYLDHFSEAGPSQIIGEITPNYLDTHHAAKRMATDCPDARLFVVLREPVSRAISSYQLLGHRFTERNFNEACQPGKYLVELGLYAKHLRRFLQHFAREQLKIMLFDDIKSRPNVVLGELCQHLGVREIEAPPKNNQVNTTVFPALQRRLQSCGLGALASWAKASPLSGMLRRIAARQKRRDSEDIDRKQIHSYFREDILDLQNLIDRDLSAWLM